MTVKVSKPAINVREELADLKKPTGIAGEAMLAAETPQEQFALIGAGRRRINHNGGMTVAQRGSSATAAVNGSYSTVDRFKFFLNANGYTTEQSTGHLADTGHDTALKISVTSADTSLALGDYYSFLQPIEAQDLQQLQYGTSSAKEMTLSFWVRATKAGAQAVFVTKDDNTRYNFVEEYTINQSDTWEYKTIAIPPLTASAIANDNDTGIRIGWILAYGSTYQTSTIGSWTTNVNAFSTANAVNNMDSTSNTFYLTGVQLEVGKVATPFEHRSYGEELALCQRYYQVLIDNDNGQRPVAAGRANSTTTVEFQLPLAVGMRDITSLPQSNMDTIYLYSGGARVNTTSGTVSLNDDYLSGAPYVYLRTTGASVSDDRAYTIGGFLASAHLAVDGEL
tara:strand:- start:140 stop:1324 length:1185 start_codon:yes stop_codon:yes gene_type:complete